MLYKKVDASSAEVANAGLDFFAIPPTSCAVSNSSYRERVVYTYSNRHNVVKIHPITSYVDLSKVFVCTEFKLKKVADDGVVVDVQANAAVGLIQMPGATFIRNLKVRINQREVYDSNQLYSYKVFLDTELSYPVAAKEAYFGVAGYFRDSDPTKVNDKRKKAVEESKSFQTISKLSADIFNQDLYMISNVEIDIELALQSDDFMIHQEAANRDKYTLEVVDCRLIVKTVDLMDGLSLDIAKKLDMEPARYGIRKTLMKSLFITGGRYEFQPPQRHTQFPYNLDYKNNRYARAYHDTQEHLGMACTTESNGISYSMFKTAYCLYVFQMTNSQEDSPGFELIKEGCTAVNIRFAEAVPNEGMSGENYSSDFVQMPSSNAVHEGIVLCFPDVIEKSPINFFLCLIYLFGAAGTAVAGFYLFLRERRIRRRNGQPAIDRALFENPATRKYFVGTFPADRLPKCTKYPCSLIVNLDPSGMPGTHWCAIWGRSPGVAFFLTLMARCQMI
ncbi:hypothetical protein niasHT_002901 [Heterodera trifolii]|uniref:Uncharacterized protein n=1 Tax=Heterodera trifolii TaxID=157864 RepID=A0ABD2LNW5_9BILA